LNSLRAESTPTTLPRKKATLNRNLQSSHFELSQGGINSDDSAQEESHLEQELAELHAKLRQVELQESSLLKQLRQSLECKKITSPKNYTSLKKAAVVKNV
jgi:hypothetical protein